MVKSVNIANKGFWVDKLGVGDFYYELAVRKNSSNNPWSESNAGSYIVK